MGGVTNFHRLLLTAGALAILACVSCGPAPSLGESSAADLAPALKDLPLSEVVDYRLRQCGLDQVLQAYLPNSLAPANVTMDFLLETVPETGDRHFRRKIVSGEFFEMQRPGMIVPAARVDGWQNGGRMRLTLRSAVLTGDDNLFSDLAAPKDKRGPTYEISADSDCADVRISLLNDKKGGVSSLFSAQSCAEIQSLNSKKSRRIRIFSGSTAQITEGFAYELTRKSDYVLLGHLDRAKLVCHEWAPHLKANSK